MNEMCPLSTKDLFKKLPFIEMPFIELIVLLSLEFCFLKKGGGSPILIKPEMKKETIYQNTFFFHVIWSFY